MKLVGMNQNEFSVTFSKMEYHSGLDVTGYIISKRKMADIISSRLIGTQDAIANNTCLFYSWVFYSVKTVSAQQRRSTFNFEALSFLGEMGEGILEDFSLKTPGTRAKNTSYTNCFHVIRLGYFDYSSKLHRNVKLNMHRIRVKKQGFNHRKLVNNFLLIYQKFVQFLRPSLKVVYSQMHILMQNN